MMSMLKADHKMKRGQSADYTELGCLYPLCPASRFKSVNCVKSSIVPGFVIMMLNGFKA